MTADISREHSRLTRIVFTNTTPSGTSKPVFLGAAVACGLPALLVSSFGEWDPQMSKLSIALSGEHSTWYGRAKALALSFHLTTFTAGSFSCLAGQNDPWPGGVWRCVARTSPVWPSALPSCRQESHTWNQSWPGSCKRSLQAGSAGGANLRLELVTLRANAPEGSPPVLCWGCRTRFHH